MEGEGGFEALDARKRVPTALTGLLRDTASLQVTDEKILNDSNITFRIVDIGSAMYTIVDEVGF